MRKFNQVFKEKQTQVENTFEEKILSEFKKVYNSLLEKYEVPEFYDLSEKYQGAFLAELNSYWSEEKGVTEIGDKFLKTRECTLNESSTEEQKKNVLQTKTQIIIDETIRQTNIKNKLYCVLDTMYNEVKASNISEVLAPEVISEIIKESFVKTLKGLLREINWELKESAKKE
jgi:hypothetical protein